MNFNYKIIFEYNESHELCAMWNASLQPLTPEEVVQELSAAFYEIRRLEFRHEANAEFVRRYRKAKSERDSLSEQLRAAQDEIGQLEADMQSLETMAAAYKAERNAAIRGANPYQMEVENEAETG